MFSENIYNGLCQNNKLDLLPLHLFEVAYIYTYMYFLQVFECKHIKVITF